MITTAVANLQESILQAEAEVSSLAKQQREKRAELRRYHKALKALTGDAVEANPATENVGEQRGGHVRFKRLRRVNQDHRGTSIRLVPRCRVP